MFLPILAALATAGCSSPDAPGGSLDWWGSPEPTPASDAGLFGGSAEAQPPKPSRSPGLFDGLFTRSASGDAEDGTYTILLAICRGPGSHIEQAKYYKKATEKHAGWKNLLVLHKENHSLLYWGRYRTVADAQPNLKKAKAYLTPAKIKVYSKAIVVPMPGTENPGPSEWDLAKTSDKYRYTVLRAAFYDVPEADYVGRRQFAVDYCRLLRRKNVPAYFKHDAAQSIVTIGLFDKDAVSVVKSGQKYRQVVRDQRINSVFKQYPYVAVNGRQKLVSSVDAKTGRAVKTPVTTYLIRIPREAVRHEEIIWVPQTGTGYTQPRQAPRDATGAPSPAPAPGGSGGLPAP